MKIEKYLQQSPVFALYRAQGALIDHLQNLLKKNDLHLLQALILTALFFEDAEIRPRDLAKTFQVSNSTLSHALHGLEKRSLVIRSLHPSDARGYLIHTTGVGKKKALTLVKLFDKIQEELETQMGVRSFRDFVRTLDKLISVYRLAFSQTGRLSSFD